MKTITAIKNGIKRVFSENQWNSMPKDKFGYSVYVESTELNKQIIPDEIIQKKMVGADVKKDNVVTDIPEEIITKKEKKNVVPKKSKNQ